MTPTAPPQTLIDCLRLHAERRPRQLYARFLFAHRDPVELDFAAMLRRTQLFASAYARHGVGPGAVVMVVLEHHEDALPAFLGAMWLRACPTFLPMPSQRIEPAYYAERVRLAIQKLEPRAILTRAPMVEALRAHTVPVGALVLLTPAELTHECAAAVDGHADDIAFLQLSSGSTGAQKAAAVTHRAALAEVAGVQAFFAIGADDHILTWVPLYHDWGLVCMALHNLVTGGSFTSLAAEDWIKRPAMAFEAVHRYRASVYFQPNFAYNVMAQRIHDREMAGIDLRSLRLVSNGAEPCRADSLDQFIARFAPFGLQPQAMAVMYGLSEATGAVTANGPGYPIVTDYVKRSVLQSELRAEPVGQDHPDAQAVLSVGRALPGIELRVVDAKRADRAEREIGEVAIRSPSMMCGYYGNPDATARVLDHDGWYYTGDLGYLVGERLFLTGRQSDLIITAGNNIFPEDIEAIVAEHPAAIAGRVVAVGVDDARAGTQSIVVIVESRSEAADVLRDLAAFARREVQQRLGVTLAHVVHAPYRWLRKTSSGKVARRPTLARLPELVRLSSDRA